MPPEARVTPLRLCQFITIVVTGLACNAASSPTLRTTPSSPALSAVNLAARAVLYLRSAVSVANSLLITKDDEAICQSLIELGPATIKIGQSLASRPDLVGPSLAKAFQRLQDNVPASLSHEEVLAILHADFPHLADVIDVDSISRSAVAAASLGQVHRANLKSTPTKSVAIKLQRPDALQLINADLALARAAARVVQPFLLTNLTAAINEISTRILEELDYSNEAANLRLFAGLYNIDLDSETARRMPRPGVVTPLLVEPLCSERVLTMTWMEGEKLSDQRNLSKDVLLRVTSLGIRCSLSQLLETGVLHADPHGGNLLVDSQGRLAYLDFGLVAKVPEKVRLALLCSVVHLVSRDCFALAGEFADLMLLSESDLARDRIRLAAALELVVAGIFDFSGAPPSSSAVSVDLGPRPLPSLKFDALVASLAPILQAFSFQAPPYFVNNIRAIGTLEGAALAADESFSLFALLHPFMLGRLLDEIGRGPGLLGLGRVSSSSSGGGSTKLLSLLEKLTQRDDGSGLLDWPKTRRLLLEATQTHARPGSQPEAGAGAGAIWRLVLRFLTSRGGFSFALQAAGRHVRWWGTCVLGRVKGRGLGWGRE